jgi:hypothetical protein
MRLVDEVRDSGEPVMMTEARGSSSRLVHLMKTAYSNMDNRCYPSFSERDGRLFSIWWPAPNAVRSVDRVGVPWPQRFAHPCANFVKNLPRLTAD